MSAGNSDLRSTRALPCFIAGARVLPEPGATTITSLDGSVELAVSETSSVQLRRALRHADACQARLAKTSLSERTLAARLLVQECQLRADEACWALAHFRGLTCTDTRWMCQVNVGWAEHFDLLGEIMFGEAATGELLGASRRDQRLPWRSKGKACLFSSSTMDGPAAVVAICHAMISGTHLIMKPSFRDAATQIAFEVLHERGLSDYAQLVRWRSESPEAAKLNRQLVANVAQSVIFSSNETYRGLLEGIAPAGSDESESLRQRAKRYGTGLPLAVVTARGDLAAAARDLVEGARLGGGRFCLSTCPVLVERSCHDALLAKILACTSALRRGPALSEETQLSSHDPTTSEGMRLALRSFGGAHAHGVVRDSDMDVVVLSEVPLASTALHHEVPGPVLALIPVDDLRQAEGAALAALRRNHRDAWTAVVVFGGDADFEEIQESIPAFRYLRGGVVAQVKLLLPHQGSYFALDLMRRVTVE